MQRARIDPTFDIAPGAVPADAWDAIFAKIDTLQDTRDFDGLELLNVLYDYADDPLLAPGLIEKVEQTLLSFKFWYTEPTPDGVIDESYYWTENHQIIYHAIEYLMGQRYPDRAIGRDGRTGAEHLEHARALLMQWFDFRARYGFTEWHSNVYYQEDHDALLTLAEFAEDPAVQQRAAAMLDALLFDIAIHTHAGSFGVTHGRSYKKDKMTGRDDDTWNAVRLLFDRSEGDYTSRSDTAAVFLSRAARYRVPEAIWRAGRSDAILVDRERMSLPLDENGPYEPDPVAPGGYSFTDPDDLPIWWGMQALTAWEVVPLTVQTIDDYNLWDTQLFSRFRPLRPLTADIVVAQQAAASLGPLINFGLLEEVNTYTYRTPDYLLSSAQDYRPGGLNGQIHSWQATFGADAILFTQHPAVPDRAVHGLARRSRSRLLDRRSVDPARGATGERRHLSLCAPVRRHESAAARRIQVRALHARLRAAGSLRRGGAAGVVDLHPQGRRLRGAVLVPADGMDHQRPERRRHQRHDQALRPARAGRSRQRLDPRVRPCRRLGQLRRLPRRRSRRRR